MSSVQTSAILGQQPKITGSAEAFPVGNLPDELIAEIVKKLDFPTLERLEKTDEFWANYTVDEWRSIAKQIGCPPYGDPKAQVFGFIKDLREKINNCPENKPDDITKILEKPTETLTIPEINLLQDCLKARDTLVVWAQLAVAIGGQIPNRNFADSSAVIDEAKKFSGWITEHQEQLFQLTNLDLSGMHLTSLPPEIGKLTGLERLFLQINSLTALPPEFSELKQLKELNLSENQFIRTPEEICEELPMLQQINLSNNPFPQLMLERSFNDQIASLKSNTKKVAVATVATVAAAASIGLYFGFL